MYMKSKELDVLLEVESYLWNNNLSMELYQKLHEINAHLLERKTQQYKKMAQITALKRKDNKFYARSKKEIERMLKNESKKQ